MKKGIQYNILFGLIIGLVVLAIVTFILRDKIYALLDSFIKMLSNIT